MPTCDACYWGLQCADEKICDDFTPLEEDLEAVISARFREYEEDMEAYWADLDA